MSEIDIALAIAILLLVCTIIEKVQIIRSNYKKNKKED